jgi:hypothetical protein
MKNKKKNTLPIKREGEKYYSTMTGHGVIYDVGGGGGGYAWQTWAQWALTACRQKVMAGKATYRIMLSIMHIGS